MMLQKEQMKHLKLDEHGDLKFINSDKVTDAEIEELIEIDSEYFQMSGEHLITNYQELRTKK